MTKAKTRLGGHKKFGSMRVLRDGRVLFSEWTLPGLTPLAFVTVYASDHVGPSYSVHADWYGNPIFIVYVKQDRIETTCFAYHLSPDQLRDAVRVIRDAGNGLERWIAAGLEWTQMYYTQTGKKPETMKIIPELLESVRDLPVAEQWKRWRRRREAEQKQEAREQARQATARDKSSKQRAAKRAPKKRT